MVSERAALPEHPEDLRQYCEQLLAELHAKNQLIDKLSHELALFRRYLYGRRAEKLDPAQLLLEFASWLTALNEAAPAEAEGAQDSSPPATPHPRPGHGRKPLTASVSAARARGACAAGGAGPLWGVRGASGEDRRGDE